MHLPKNEHEVNNDVINYIWPLNSFHFETGLCWSNGTIHNEKLSKAVQHELSFQKFDEMNCYLSRKKCKNFPNVINSSYLTKGLGAATWPVCRYLCSTQSVGSQCPPYTHSLRRVCGQEHTTLFYSYPTVNVLLPASVLDWHLSHKYNWTISSACLAHHCLKNPCPKHPCPDAAPSSMLLQDETNIT